MDNDCVGVDPSILNYFDFMDASFSCKDSNLFISNFGNVKRAMLPFDKAEIVKLDHRFILLKGIGRLIIMKLKRN